MELIEVSYQPDGMVRIEEKISFYRYIPEEIYEITQALDALSDEEIIKVMKYIRRITKKRFNFQALARKPSKKAQIRALKKVDAKYNSL